MHAWDDDAAARARASDKGVPLDDINQRDWSLFSALILAPGVPLTHPTPHRIVELARMTETPIYGDIELFMRAVAEAPAHARPKIIGVTGTNGKSTTTALIGHIFAHAGRDAHVGGNIGVPALDLPDIHAGAVYALELSSFQLELAPSTKPDVGVFLNIAPDHLDRHGTMEAYVAAKRTMFANQTEGDAAVVGVDDAFGQRIAMELAQPGRIRVAPISANRALSRGVHAVGGVLYDAIDGRVEEVVDLKRALALPGRHNWQNAAAAYAAARLLGLAPKKIAEGLVSFPGLPHRMEEVARAGAVRFINDSKATNVAAARQALACFENVYWIAGGKPKKESFADLAPLMARVGKVLLIGEAAETIASQLKSSAIVEIVRTLDAAVERAAADAAASGQPNPVVLFSPACASFDQFPNYAARGDAFRELAKSAARRIEKDAAA